MKIVNNKKKYTNGTKFHLFGVPVIVIGEGLVMTYNPIIKGDNWIKSMAMANNFIKKNANKWFIPTKEDVQKHLSQLKKIFSTQWLWTSSLLENDNSHAWDYDFSNRNFYNDPVADVHSRSCVHLFYRIF